jgi:hypothetical protein
MFNFELSGPVYLITMESCKFIFIAWFALGEKMEVVFARFEVFTAMKTEVVICWAVTPCGVVFGY